MVNGCNLISNSSDFFTDSWAAFTVWLVIPRFEQKRLWEILPIKLIKPADKNEQPKRHLILRRTTHHKISGVDGSHFNGLSGFKAQLFDYVFFCTTNLLLSSSIGNRTYFYIIFVSRELRKKGNDGWLKSRYTKTCQNCLVPLTVRGLSSWRQAMYKQAAKRASWFLPLLDFWSSTLLYISLARSCQNPWQKGFGHG